MRAPAPLGAGLGLRCGSVRSIGARPSRTLLTSKMLANIQLKVDIRLDLISMSASHGTAQMSVSSPTFSPTDLAEAAAWSAGRGTGWKAEPAHVDSSTLGLGVRRPENLYGVAKAVFPLASSAVPRGCRNGAQDR